MIKLKKISDAGWVNNFVGHEAAEWVVKGHEHINVWQGSGQEWSVTNRITGERILRGIWTRNVALELLEDKHPELAS